MGDSFVTNKEGFIQSVFFAPETSDHPFLSHFYDFVCVCVGAGRGAGRRRECASSGAVLHVPCCGSHEFGNCPRICCLYSSFNSLKVQLGIMCVSGLFCELPTLWEARKSQSFFCSEILLPPTPPVTSGVDTVMVLQRMGSVPAHSSGPYDTRALRISFLSKWWENCSLDIWFPLKGFLLYECFVLNPPGFSF